MSSSIFGRWLKRDPKKCWPYCTQKNVTFSTFHMTDERTHSETCAAQVNTTMMAHTHVRTGYCSSWASWLQLVKRKWSLSCTFFLNTNNSCVHTHSTPKNTHKRIYTHKPSTLFTRTFTQQRGSGVFSFDPIHAILVFHAVSPNRKHNTHAHTGPNIHIFTRQSALFFFTPTSTISPF